MAVSPARVAAWGVLLGWLVPTVACAPSAHDSAVLTANVVEATGRVQIAALNHCEVELRREAEAAQRAAQDDGPDPIMRTDEQLRALVRACDAVRDSYGVVQATHAALLAAIDLAQRAEQLGQDPRWSDVATLAADALAATERARQAIEAFRAVRGPR